MAQIFLQHPDVSAKAFEKGDYLGKGCKLINSEEFSGLTVEEAKAAITDKLVKMGIARKKINYHFREWIFARQSVTLGELVPVAYIQKTAGFAHLMMMNSVLYFLNLKTIKARMARHRLKMLMSGKT